MPNPRGGFLERTGDGAGVAHGSDAGHDRLWAERGTGGDKAGPAGPASSASAPATAAPRPASAPIEKIQVSFASISAVYTPFLIAMDKGYLAEDGLEIEMIHVGGGVGTPALFRARCSTARRPPRRSSAILKGAPLKVIYTNADRAGYDLWTSAPDVRTLSDLIGKSIGIQSRGDTMEIEARMVLQQNGIDHNAVGYVAMGVGNQRLVSLQMGDRRRRARDVGHGGGPGSGVTGRILADLRKDVQMLYMGVATSDQSYASAASGCGASCERR